MTCGARQPTREVLARLDAEPDPACARCGGVLKPDVVYFGEMLPERALERAVAAATDAQTFVVVGSTLTVHPVAGLAQVAADAA
ncbi:NAD-dependent deacetylase, partial [Priestia megaterium]